MSGRANLERLFSLACPANRVYFSGLVNSRLSGEIHGCGKVVVCHVMGAMRMLLELTQRIVETIQSAAKRMVDFSDRHQRTVELAYDPPYHTKFTKRE